MKREVLQNDGGPCRFRALNESFRDLVETLTDPMPLPPALAGQQTADDSSIARLFLREPSTSPEMGLLNSSNAPKRQHGHDHAFVGCDDTIHRVLIRVESDRPFWLISLRRLLPDDDDDLARHHGEGPEAPRWIAQE